MCSTLRGLLQQLVELTAHFPCPTSGSVCTLGSCISSGWLEGESLGAESTQISLDGSRNL